MLQIVVDILWFQEHSHIWLEWKYWLKDISALFALRYLLCVIWIFRNYLACHSCNYIFTQRFPNLRVSSKSNGWQCEWCIRRKYNLIVYACGRLRLRKFEPVGIFLLELLHHVNCSSLQEDPSIKNNKNIICANLITQQYSAWLVTHFHHLAAPPNLRV